MESFKEVLKSTIHFFPHNKSYVVPGLYDVHTVDADFILSATLIFFTIQTGIALLEAGILSKKNEVNVMMKKFVDICCVGFAYYIFGFAFMYGRGEYTNPFIGLGDFFVNADKDDELATQVFTFFFFQISFATTSTSIASGGAGERFRFSAHIIFCIFSCAIYSIGAGWVWGQHGFLKNLGVIDFSGSGAVHIIGGASALATAYFVGPRIGRFDNGIKPIPVNNPFNLCLGTMIVMWGWYGFNLGSSYGLNGTRWDSSARAGVTTVIASMASGFLSIICSMVKNKGKVLVIEVSSGILSSMAALNAGCFLYSTHVAVLVGTTSTFLCFITSPIMDQLKIDDAIGATPIHLVGGIWGLISVGLFADPVDGHRGLFYGGGYFLLCIQTLEAICLTAWSIIATLFSLWIINKIILVRLSAEEEMLGCDLIDHIEINEQISDQERLKSRTDEVLSNKILCPCLLSHNNALNKRNVWYVNENFEH